MVRSGPLWKNRNVNTDKVSPSPSVFLCGGGEAALPVK